MAQTAPAFAWMTDANARSTFFSRGWLKHTGQTEETALSADGWLEPVHPEERQRVRKARLAATARRQPFQLEYRVRRRDGQYSWFLDAVHPRFDADGEYLGYIGSLLDITERKQAEAELQRTRDTPQAVVDHAPSAVLVTDEKGHFLMSNPAVHQLMGESANGHASGPSSVYTLHRLDGRPFPAEELPLVRALRGEPSADVEILIRRADGSEVVILAAATPLHDRQGGIWGAVAVMQDITDRKRAEKQLQEQQDFSARIIQGTLAIICGIEPDGTTTFINPAGEAITGCGAADLIGKNWWSVFYPGEEYQQVEQLFRDFEKGDVRDYEMTLTTRHGKKRTISWNSILTRDDHGNILCNIGFGNDITERKRAEAALAQLNATLGLQDWGSIPQIHIPMDGRNRISLPRDPRQGYFRLTVP